MSISVIIPAHNEQAVIACKLDNILATTYPSGAFEVLVGKSSVDVVSDTLRIE